MDHRQHIEQLRHLCIILHDRYERSLTQSARRSAAWREFNQDYRDAVSGKTEGVQSFLRRLADPRLKTIRHLIPDTEWLEQTVVLLRGSTALLDPEDPAPIAVATARKIADKLEGLLDQ